MSNYYNGTSAYKIDNYGLDNSNVQEHIEKRQETRISKKAAFVKRVRLCVAFICVFATAIGFVFTNAMIIEKSSEANELQTKLDKLTDANNQKAVDLEKNLDLKKIEDIAINELGMKRPDKYQVVYINVQQSNYAEITQGGEKTDEEEESVKTFGDSVNQFMEYIN